MDGETVSIVQEKKNTISKSMYSEGSMNAPLFSWPWENFGSYKYLFYLGLFAKYYYYSDSGGDIIGRNWCFHILLLWLLRVLVYYLWGVHNMMFFLNSNRRISQKSVDYRQIDAEWHWDNFLILQAIMAILAFFSFPSLSNLPLWDWRGALCCLALHIGVSEPLYYLLHRLLHSPELFSQYHWLHHSSKVLHPFTAGHATLLEHLLLCVIIGGPPLVTAFFGFGSIAMMYGYVLLFDFFRCLGHSNIEVIPYHLFEAFPLLKYLIHSASYHSTHHSTMQSNFCLFMPVFDVLGRTIDTSCWDLQRDVSSRKYGMVPDFVFLVHSVDIISSLHAPFVYRSFSSIPFRTKLFLFPSWPFVFLVMLAMWAKSKTFLYSFYHLRGKLHHTWVVPRFGFQYFLPFAAEGINKLIEDSILKANKLGVKVISLAALNKNEGLNGGGTLFVNKHPDLKVCVVHGNTLTAAVILNEIPRGVDEVFLTGATSKLGRAIALYLARRSVRVMMLTQSAERFRKIQKEAPEESQKFLVQVTKYQSAKHCKTWIIGKWCSLREQSWAPSGTHFHQFVVPPIISFRRDCTYGKLAAMRLPEDVEGLGSCEYTMERGVVHACHAGGVVHFLEGWKHHEVGAISVDQIDVVWEASLRHGLKPI